MKTVPISVDYVDHSGSDLSVVNAARVSYDKESHWAEYEEGELLEKDQKLIKYLAKNNHTSPFNHCFLSVRVKAPIFVARQLVKHEYMPWNEVSRRYVDNEPEFHMLDFRIRVEDKKQGSGDLLDEDPQQKAQRILKTISERALISYFALLDLGVCPEQARAALPINLSTEWIWSGTLGAFAKMLKLRTDNHTQQEAKEVADRIKEIAERHFPVSIKALMENA